MGTLADLRKELDEIDDQIVELFEKRMDVCEQVAQDKMKTGKRVFDRQREQEKLSSVSEKAGNEFNKKGIREVFEQLMSMSRKLQYQKLVENGNASRLPFIAIDHLDAEGARIVYQGVEGAYSQAALEKYFGKDKKSFRVPTFRDAMLAIEDGTADYAVLPIENSTAGAVYQVYDLLAEFENYIIGETLLPIQHMLAAYPGTTIQGIERVYSHPQGLMQCSRFLNEHQTWQQVATSNTAIAAKKVFEEKRPDQAAICSEYAAKIYGLDILENHINKEQDNSTRFIVVTNQKIFLKDASKISLSFEVRHETGSLYHILSHFIYNDLNMTKIESRPIEGRRFEYRFFVDIEGNLADAAVKNAILGLREEAMNLRILGNY